MALRKTYSSTRFGQTFDNAYNRVTEVVTGTSGVRVGIAVFADAQAATDNKQPVENLRVDLDYEETPTAQENAIADAYRRLKLLPEFSGAVDV